jgi:nucleoid-associated protein YgaU
MAALLHPDSLSLFSAEPQPAVRVEGTAPWNAPEFLDEVAAAPRRPQLRLIAGGLDAAPTGAIPAGSASTRRPLHTLLGGVALAVLMSLAAIGMLNLLGADAAATVPASPAVINHPTGADATTTTPSAPVEVVVQPGDTIWSIARRIHPTGEVRGVVDELQRRVGGTSLEAGQRIDVRGLASE